MAAYAYTRMQQPVLVEEIQAHAGMDIGETMIGMHLRRVAVPLRPSIRHDRSGARANGLHPAEADRRSPCNI